jgi:hypothetical protein
VESVTGAKFPPPCGVISIAPRATRRGRPLSDRTEQQMSHPVRGAALWALAAATCTGGSWALALVTAHFLAGIAFSPRTLAQPVTELALNSAVLGAVYGFVVTTAVALIRRHGQMGVFVAGGVLVGALGGGLSVLVAITIESLHPLVSSALALAAVGFLAGCGGYVLSLHQNGKTSESASADEEQSREVPTFSVVTWVLGGAVCAASAWALGMVVGGLLMDSSPSNPKALGIEWSRLTLEVTAVVALCGATLGGSVGVLAGLLRKRHRGARAVALGAIGVSLGTVGGAVSIPIVLACGESVHPLVSSSLAWAVVGGLAGLAGYGCSRRLTKPAQVDEAEEADARPRKRIEWLLREVKWPFRDRPLVRVLPVLVASGAALLGAALVAPSSVSAALLAVGVLGLMVALVLYRQEERLRALERPRRNGHD